MTYLKLPHTALLAVIGLLLTGMISSDIMERWHADRPLAYVRRFKPSVDVVKMNKTEKAVQGEALFSGDTLQTDQNGYALVQFMDKSMAKVRPNSMLVVQGEVRSRNNTAARIGLKFGEIFLNVTKRSASNFEVATSTAVASVKGTQFGARERDDFFWVTEGSIELAIHGTGQSAMLNEKMFGVVNPNGQIETGELTDEEIAGLSRDYEELDEKLKSKTLKLQFRDENGQLREIELEYFEN